LSKAALLDLLTVPEKKFTNHAALLKEVSVVADQ
jgi:hypothetical protein